MQIATLAEQSSQLAEHLIGLPGSQWALWRWICLRGAGFPARDVLQLAVSPEVLREADNVVQAEADVDAAAETIIHEIDQALAANNRREDRGKRAVLRKAKQRILERTVPGPSGEAETLISLPEFRAALQRLETAREVFRKRFAEAVMQSSQVLRQVAADPRFREAVTWQNRAAIHTALDPLLKERNGSPPSSRQMQHERQHEELVASYLQRYCTKNDTIGFFGPVGWAKFVDEGAGMVLNPGKTLLAQRKVYFESWPMEILAAVIARDKNVFPWLAPIMMPFVRVEGNTLHHPAYGTRAISAGDAALLRAASGVPTAKEIAAQIMASPERLFAGEAEIYKALGELAAKRLIFWGFNIPLSSRPENILGEALERIENRELRERSLGMLNELESARDVVERSAGDPIALESALSNLENTFTRLTGAAAIRGHGKTYAARTPIYEDCRRDLQIRLGPELLSSLLEPLSLLLVSARWLTAGITKLYKQKFVEIYADLVRLKGNHQVDATLFWIRAMPYLYGEKGAKPTIGKPVQEQFQEKWSRILDFQSESREVSYSSRHLQDRVAQEFSAPVAGWAEGRYHCPDVLIAASDERAIQRGDYLLVLGELHAGWNTISGSLFVQQHPAPDELVRALENDLGTPNIVPVPPKSGAQMLSRTVSCLFSPTDFRLEYGTDSFTTDRARAIPLSAFVIEKHDEELMARTRDGRFCLNAMNLMGAILGELVMDSFKMLAPGRHTPRISIDKLVVKRESWRFAPSEMSFAREPNACDRFLRARAWARSHSLPRFVFCKTPVERKPFYVDFESPILVDIFSKMVRRTLEANLPDAILDVSEMLPTAEQLWLADAEDNRYSCELRIVALDLART
jgi:Lantibiotic dehydratase, N terminus